jgi:hypothetical protein
MDMEDYQDVVKEPQLFRAWADQNMTNWSELFPSDIAKLCA